MVKKKVLVSLFLLLAVCFVPALFATHASAMNPFITDFYAADPSAHVFNNRLYVYPSHDKDDANWFDMDDYHVYSTSDMVTWVDHGVVLSLDQVQWARKWLWAPDCAYRNGTYYFYFPASTSTKSSEKTPGGPDDFRIGVATSSSPAGPFYPEPSYIAGTNSMDPCVFIDDASGQAYIYYGGKDHGGVQYPKWAKLKSNMKELASTPQDINPAPKNWYEGSWVHERNGIYYFSYATAPYPNGAQIEYATSNSPTGPWTYRGVILERFNKSTSHHSIVEYPKGSGNWYLFYHTEEMSGVGNKRALCVDRLYYNSDGTIKKVTRTRTGTGTDAYARIKAAYYNSMKGVQLVNSTGDIGHDLAYLNNGDWTTYEGVVFGSNNTSPQTFTASVASPYSGGLLEIRLGSANGTLIGDVDIPNTGGWQTYTTVSCKLNKTLNGSQTIALVFKGAGGKDGYLYNVNWFKFVRAGQVSPLIPTDIEVSFKSAYNGMYVCADKQINANKPPLVADRDKMDIWEKFEVNLISAADSIVGIRTAVNRHFWNYAFMSPVHSKGGSMINSENQWVWYRNGDGTISLKSVYSGRFLEVNAQDKNLYVSGGTTPGDNKARFYVEAHKAPIGCVVALKSYQFNSYATNSYGEIRLGDTKVSGDSYKFLVVDAGDGYIALKSVANGQYLRSLTTSDTMKPDGGTTIDSNREKFLWVDNQDGTISLKSVHHNQYICADQQKGANPIKLYTNRSEIGPWEKFYCHVQ